jgi:ubiquinone/menaquinone biosynthesis C-methylase UbiE
VPDLAPPAVSPAAYDRAYYLNANQGYEVWRDSGGSQIAGLYLGLLHEAAVKPGERLVDIGAGRGELVVAAAEAGADATGIEYSEDALTLAAETLAAHGSPASARVLAADARRLPLEDGCAEVVTMIDVIEHLDVAEQLAVLREARRVLVPGGRILIHTMPNRLIYDLTYRILRLGRPSWPRDPRNDYERAMHVGEQTARSMRAQLAAAGFAQIDVSHGRMVYTGHLRGRVAPALYRRLAAIHLTTPLAAADLWGRAVRAD